MTDDAVLLTGAAGFIGYHLATRLLADGHRVLGVDNLNAYYDPALKRARLALLTQQPGFEFVEMNIADRDATAALFARRPSPRVIHLAGQAGVRYSLQNPYAYADDNLLGFTNILEGCRHHGCEHLLFASSSSVYGANAKIPFSVHDTADHPVSFYAATKRSNELMAHSYSHLYRLPITALRFFTVYGPWYRPDMALFIFSRAIMAGEPIKLFNNGAMRRDFTYVDDVVEGIVRLSVCAPVPSTTFAGDPASSSAPWRVHNIGNSHPENLEDVVTMLEEALGRKAIREYHPMPAGDVRETYADIEDLVRETGFRPAVRMEQGIPRFAEWFQSYTS